MMSKAEYLAWCRERALLEYDYSRQREGHSSAVSSAIISVISDLRKNPETEPMHTKAAESLVDAKPMKDRNDVIEWISEQCREEGQ